jgi:hypothetical protein
MRPDALPALTLHAPWAYAVAHLGKTIENRGWVVPSRLMGQRLAIHAGARSDASTWEAVERAYGLRSASVFRDTEPRGAVVAVATVAGMVDARLEHDVRLEGIGSVDHCFSPWWIGPVGWILSDVITLPSPVPCKGRLGVWTLPAEIDAAVRAQMARAA